MSRAAKKSNLFTVALVGATALKGKEVRDVLSERSFPAVEIKLLDEDEALGQLDQVNDEPTFIQGVLPEHLEGVDFAFLTADASYIAQTWDTVRNSGAEVIDLSYALERHPGIVLRAPWIEQEAGQEAGREHDIPPALALQSAPVVIAHPAAVLLALLLGRVHRAAPLRLASAVICQPASEYGRPGLDELHDQTVNLLSLQPLPTAVFGVQAAFSLFAHSPEAAHPSLAETEARILRHFRALVQPAVVPPAMAAPAVLLVQAPVFHGYAAAIFVETGSPLTAEALESALTGPHVTVVNSQAAPEDFPSNVNIPGVSEIVVSVRPGGREESGGNSFWLFAACDNLRVSAIQAVECAEQMVRTRPRGQLQ